MTSYVSYINPFQTSKNRITFLGTGSSQGVPCITCQCSVCSSSNSKDKRLRSGIYVIIERKNILIDAGTDLRQQLLRENITYIDAILVTHAHKDHIGGLDEIKPIIYHQKKNITIYGKKEINQRLVSEYDYLFKKLNQPTEKLITRTITNAPFFIDEIKIIPIEVQHGRLSILGYRIKDFAYITDASAIAATELAKLKGVKVLIINALHKASHKAHFNLDQTITIAQQVNAEATFLTHISHTMGLHDEVSKTLPKNIYFAYDQLKIPI